MVRAIPLVLVVAGCGRLGFATVAGDGRSGDSGLVVGDVLAICRDGVTDYGETAVDSGGNCL